MLVLISFWTDFVSKNVRISHYPSIRRRLSFFAGTSQDHSWALQASIRGPPKDWWCRTGRLRQTWLRTVEDDLCPLNFCLATWIDRQGVNSWRQLPLHHVPEKTSHFNFRHNFAICWDIFTIFEAPSSGLIAGWCSSLHTHHRCEAFTWREVIHWRLSNCGAQCVMTPDFIPPDLWPLYSPNLNPVDYSFWSIMQEKVYQTHIENIDELKH